MKTKDIHWTRVWAGRTRILAPKIAYERNSKTRRKKKVQEQGNTLGSGGGGLRKGKGNFWTPVFRKKEERNERECWGARLKDKPRKTKEKKGGKKLWISLLLFPITATSSWLHASLRNSRRKKREKVDRGLFDVELTTLHEKVLVTFRESEDNFRGWERLSFSNLTCRGTTVHLLGRTGRGGAYCLRFAFSKRRPRKEEVPEE